MVIRFSLLFLALLFGGFIAEPAQGQRPGVQRVSADDVKRYIQKSKESGGSWGRVQEKYVLDNFARPELNQEIDNWQIGHGFWLSKDVRIMVEVDYLLTELRRMSVIDDVLGAIAKGESTSVANQLLTQVSAPAVRLYQPARIQVVVNLTSVDVEIDDTVFDRAPNNQMFVVMAGQSHSVKISQSGFSECTKTVNPDPGRIAVVACTLNSIR